MLLQLKMSTFLS